MHKLDKQGSSKPEQLKLLMKRVAEQRDQAAFNELFEHFAPLLISYSLARDPGAQLLADDLAQQVLIKIWHKAHTYNPEKSAVSTWVYTLARNCRIDNLRRNGRFNTDIDAEDLYKTIEDEGLTPFQATQQRKAADQIEDALKTLPIEQSQVLSKVYLEGKSHQETSDELDLPLGTVKSRVRLALRKLSIIIKH